MKAVLLIDFGSTMTKVTAVDVETEEILGTSQSYTTIETDIINGLNNAVALLKEKIGDVTFVEQYACSSAAGGLRMVAIGLVPELTAKAARQASLGAGAKVIKTYSYELTESDLAEIDEINPDICLLTGGTDGGNKENIVFNANMLARSTRNFPIIIAGNRNCADTCKEILKDKQTHVCENVMPRLDIPNVGPVQAKIREIFLEQIVKAKGLSNAEALVGDILMPTPSAMLTAMKLLAKGTKTEEGIGDLVGVDLGGATTDIYSMSFGLPTTGMCSLKGLREEYAKRTVEGDIGMRYSIHGIVDAAGIDRVSELSGLDEDRCRELVDYLSVHTDVVPGEDDELEKLDYALASLAIETAVTRHAGRLEQFYSPMGISYMQTGKDLTAVKVVIVTGGALIHTKRTGAIAAHAQFSPLDAMSLKPKEAEVLVDRKYILAAMGLLSTVYPDTALRIMKRELIKDGTRN
ncbi:MAG: MutL protein [Ruminococcaceae bacterium]|nr:MutL protein [Oscillospiraceae bacterium]MBQ9969478.1 glutamate mutase L [Oscillospiraceae bacterium]